MAITVFLGVFFGKYRETKGQGEGQPECPDSMVVKPPSRTLKWEAVKQ